MPKYAKKVDRSQPAIVDELRKRGVQVHVTNFGNDFPDLLCSGRAGWVLVEVKEPGGDLSRGQLEFIAEAKGHVGVATDADEAVALVNFPMLESIAPGKQDRIAAWLVRNPTQKSLSIRKFREVIA